MLNSITVNGIILTPWLGGYSTSFEGDEVEFTGSSAVQAIFRARRLVLEVTVNEGDQTIYQRLKSTMFNQGTSGVTVIDNISPDSETSTTRQMYLSDVRQVSGSITSIHGLILSKGTSIKLIEIEPHIF